MGLWEDWYASFPSSVPWLSTACISVCMLCWFVVVTLAITRASSLANNHHFASSVCTLW